MLLCILQCQRKKRRASSRKQRGSVPLHGQRMRRMALKRMFLHKPSGLPGVQTDSLCRPPVTPQRACLAHQPRNRSSLRCEEGFDMAPTFSSVISSARQEWRPMCRPNVAWCRLVSLQEKMLALLWASSFDSQCVRKCPVLSASKKILGRYPGGWSGLGSDRHTPLSRSVAAMPTRLRSKRGKGVAARHHFSASGRCTGTRLVTQLLFGQILMSLFLILEQMALSLKPVKCG